MSEPTGHTVDGTPWEEPRGPHLPDRVVGVPPMAWLFIATAIVVTIADLPTLARMGSGPWFLGQGILGLVPPICSCLLGAVLFIRHPDAVQALPLLVLGAMLSAAVPVLRLGSTLVASILEGWSPSVDMSSTALSFVTVAVRPRSPGTRAKSIPSRKPLDFRTGLIVLPSSNDGTVTFFASLTKICGTSFASATT